MAMVPNDDSLYSTNSSEAVSTIPKMVHIDLPLHPTFMIYNQFTNIPFISGHMIHNENLIAVGNEMVGYVVGPMPAKISLDFLPCNPHKGPLFNKESHDSVIQLVTAMKS